MKNVLVILFFLTTFINIAKANGQNLTGSKSNNFFWLTKADHSVLLEKQKWKSTSQILDKKTLQILPRIIVQPQEKLQSIDGFGFTLTGGSADLINKLPESEKNNLLKELFSRSNSLDDNFIGISYLRISLGASDLSSEVFSYDDLPAGQENDPDLKRFSLGNDLKNLVPLLKKIININPKIKILASPWSAPAWMKTNKSSIAGNLDSRYYSSYAKYFVKYIKAMEKEGITIDALTVQNEPLNPKNNPSMLMEASEQLDFVKKHLGPLFKNELIKTKIVLWDHNCDNPEYPLSILKDKEAAKYIDGSAFHLYMGTPDALSKVHTAFPTKNLYLTEQWVGGPGHFGADFIWHIKNMIIGSVRNWSKSVLEWNLAADSQYGPHTIGGCSNCLGALTIDLDASGNLKSPIRRNTSYYIIAQASKFIPTGSSRVASESSSSTLSDVAFQNTKGQNILIVLNENKSDQEFIIQFKSKQRTALLPGSSVGTFVWDDTF